MWEVYGSWPSWCTDGQTPAECFLARGTALAGMSSVQAKERGVDSDPTHWGRATQHHPITLPHSTQTAASSPFPEHAQARVWGLSVSVGPHVPSAQTQGFLSPHRCSHSNGQHMEKKNQGKAGITEAHPAQIYCLCKLRLFCLLAFSDSGSIVAITVYVQDVWVRQEKTIWISIGSDFCHTSDYNANPCCHTNTAYNLKSCLSHKRNSHFNLCFIHYVEYKTPNGPYKTSKWFLVYLLSVYENGLVCMVSTFCFWSSCNCTLWHDINQP